MHAIDTLELLNQFIQKNNSKMILLYFTTRDCGVCKALLPKIEQMLANYPEIVSAKIEIDDLPEVRGDYSIFTVPVILLYLEGKELNRWARFVSIGELEKNITRYYSFLKTDE